MQGGESFLQNIQLRGWRVFKLLRRIHIKGKGVCILILIRIDGSLEFRKGMGADFPDEIGLYVVEDVLLSPHFCLDFFIQLRLVMLILFFPFLKKIFFKKHFQPLTPFACCRALVLLLLLLLHLFLLHSKSIYVFLFFDIFENLHVGFVDVLLWAFVVSHHFDHFVVGLIYF